MDVEDRKIRIAEHIDLQWISGVADCLTCPNCGAARMAPRLLEIDYAPPGARHFFTVNACAHCGAKFFGGDEPMDYATDELIEIGWHLYQIQIGAGLWPIAAPLARIDKPAGARILEIGGAYGFGLDFATRACRWDGIGYDPSPLAALGAAELGLRVEQDYFREQALKPAGFDVVLATEVIEHLPEPPGFLRLMRRALAADGILLLTTPDGEKLTPGLAPAELLPILSPGAHVVLQTETSLRHALTQAGFAHVEIERNGSSLIAHAGDSPFTLRAPAAGGRAMFRDYLLARSRSECGSDLLLGFAGRALFEAVNDGDFAGADEAWCSLRPGILQRFDIDLNDLTALPAGAGQASLAELASRMPLGLGMMLYSRAVQLVQQGEPRELLLPMFRLAAAALDALQAALGRRSLRDGLAASLRPLVDCEIMLCRAAAGDADCIAAASALGRRDPCHVVTVWRVFILLVNAGRFSLALQLQREAGLYAPHEALSEELRRDALFTTAVLALQDEADWPRAAAIFAQLGRLLRAAARPGSNPGHLFWPALRGELKALENLGRIEQAASLRKRARAEFSGAPADL